VRKGAVGILIAAAAVAGYLVGARSGEGPGTQARRETRTERTETEVAEPARATQPPLGFAEPTRQPAEDEPAAAASRTEPGGQGAGTDPAPVEAPGSPFEARLRDDLDRGGSMGLLRGLLAERPDMPWTTATGEGAAAIVGDLDTFARVFAPRVEGRVLEGHGADWRTLADGTTLAYGEGIHEVRWEMPAERFPRDLVLKGMGMDRTLLRVSSPPLTGEIHGFTLVDATVDCQGGKLLWLKSGLVALRLVRCRVIRTETIVDGADASALRAEGCEFERGKLPEYARCALLHTTRGLARVDECMFREAIDVGEGGTFVACLFRRCTFEAAHPNLQSNLERRRGVRLDGCRFEVVQRPPPPRSLQTINPAWRD
jgi:hypothetical protein